MNNFEQAYEQYKQSQMAMFDQQTPAEIKNDIIAVHKYIKEYTEEPNSWAKLGLVLLIPTTLFILVWFATIV